MPLSFSLSGSQASQRISDQSTIVPLASATIADDIGQTETVTVTLSAAGNGTLTNLGSGSYDPRSGVFTDSGSAAAVTRDLDALTFTPTPQQVAPGQTVTTVFRISDTDTAGSSVSDSTTSVIATAGTLVPTISNTVASQAATDHTSIAPFAWTVIGDLNVGQTETLTVKLSAAANGAFTNLGGGSYNGGSGIYTDHGSAAAITADLEALLFVPTQNQVALGRGVATGFTIGVTDSAGAGATDATTSVIATAVTLPTISNTVSGQAVSDQTTIMPFAGVTIADVNAGQTETVTVTLSAAANGSLTNVGGGFYNFLTGVYTDSGSAAAVSNDLDNLVFVPTEGQVPVGQTLTTGFSISDTDTDGLNVTDNTTSVRTTAVAAPSIANTAANQALTDHATIMPFAGVVVADINPGQTQTVTVTLSTTANGTLTNPGHGSYNATTGVYTDVGSAAMVSSDLDNLVFVPTQAEVGVGQTVTTGFTINDTDNMGASAGDSTTSVIVTDVAVPAIGNTASGQAVTDRETITPFAAVAITDANAGQTETLTVTLSAAGNGTLTNLGAGHYNATTGVYTDSGSVASVTSDLNGLLFIPTPGQVALGGTVVTGFTIRDSDTVGTSATDATTSVVATAVALPTISNTVASQTVSDHAAISPFAGVSIADANLAQTQTLTVTLSAPANGRLGTLGGGSYNPATGVYTDTGTAAAVTHDLDALVFNPTQGEVAVGQTVTTRFSISDSDTVGSTATDSATSVIATAIAAPIIRNTVAGQALNDQQTIAPFSAVVIADANSGQTETVTVTLSAAANGSLTHLGSGSYSAGVFTDHGSAAAVTADLDGLLFVPTKTQVGLGQTITTGFTIAVTDSAGFTGSDAETSVVTTAVTPPTISNTRPNQAVFDQATIMPFAAVVIADANPGQSETVTVKLSNAANGTLTATGGGSYNATTGVYTDTGSAATVTGDLEGLVFAPTPNQVALGQSVSTGFTIIVNDTAGLVASDSASSVIATSSATPTIGNTAAAQAVTDHATIRPFSGVVLQDLNPGQTETVTVMLSSPANGGLTNLGNGSYDPRSGLYTVSGSAAAVTAALVGLVFTPTAAEVGVGQTVTTGFIISDTDTAGLTVTDPTTSVVATAVTPPIISNTAANQTVTDQTTIAPFANVVIGEFNAGQTEALTVTLSAPGNGNLSSLGAGSYDINTGVYTDTGSAAAVTADLEGLVFTPTPGLAGIGQTITTRFTISDTDSLGLNTTDATSSVLAVGFTAPTIANTVANQAVSDLATIMPFLGVVVADSNAGQTESVTVTLSSPVNGTLTNPGNGSYDPIRGIYTDTGSAAAITADLHGLVFNPTLRQVAPGQTVTTGFTISDIDTALAGVVDSTTSVITTASTVLPTISGAIANQPVAATATIVPFANVVVSDVNLGQTETVTVKLSATANGSLTNLGNVQYDPMSGLYIDIGSAAAISADLNHLVFNPTPRQVAPGLSVTTVFTITDTDTAQASASNAATSVIATAGTLAPTISGSVGGQAVTSPGSIAAFSGVAIGDVNFGQTETVTVKLSAPANGSLTNFGGGGYNATTGVYTIAGSALAVTTALDGLVFIPKQAQVAPGQSVTTGFVITDTDTASAQAIDTATTVISTAGTLAPTIAGTIARQAVNPPATIKPFTGVSIADPNFGQAERVTVTLSAPANGTLTNLGGGTYTNGVYTVSGSATAVSVALQGLVFNPTPQQVQPGQSVTTVFTIVDTDTASAAASDSTASVIATAGSLVPTITGTVSNQTVAASGTILPFAGVTIGDANFGQTETLTISLPSANGTLTNLGGGGYANGVYTDVGSAAALTRDLEALVFNPAPHQVDPGATVTTVFTITDTDTASAQTTNGATTVIATTGTVLPAISGAVAGQVVTAPGTITPFSAVTISDLNFGQVETVTVTLSAPANGTLTNLGGGTYSAGIYTVTGTAAAVNNALHGLVFTPTPHQVTPAQTVTTSFTINDIDSASARAASATASVIATAGTIAPTITGTTAPQTVGASGTITPFSSVVLGDANLGQTEIVTVSLSSAANGALTNLGGFSSSAAGIYTYTGSAAAVSAALNGLIFNPTPHQVQPGQDVTTVFSITDVDTAGASAVNNTTSVIAVAGTVAPTITGVVTGQTVTAGATISPFAGVLIGDLNVGQTETVTVTLSAAANGTLTNLGGFSPGAAPGVYTDVGPAATVTRDLDGLVFNPAPHQVAPGQTVATVFTISDTDTALAHVADNTTSVIATIGTLALTISGAVAAQTIAAPGMIRPFAGVVVADLAFGQTQTLAVTLSSPANGFLSNLGSGSYNATTGMFTDTGSAAAVTADLEALVFNPTASLVANGQAVTTGFTITDTDGASANLSDSTTSVITTAGIGANPAGDILLQSNNGQLALWQVNGSAIIAGGGIQPNPGPSWFAMGVGGFYPGDTSDILWQNQNGSVVTWRVQGVNVIASSVLPNPGSAWHVKGTGDFFGDGNTDILWQNDDGSVELWDIQGGTIVKSGSVSNPGSAWHVECSGDFFRNGSTAILLQNDNGQIVVWDMNGTQIMANSGPIVDGSGQIVNPGPTWRIKGTGDFYGNGDTDILLQNDNGQIVVWDMNGTTIIGGGNVANPGPTWHVQGTGDFNNQGKNGVVLQNEDGSVVVWQMNGLQVVGGGPLANPGPTWSVFGSGETMRFIHSSAANETLAATPTNPDEFIFTSVAAGLHTITGFNAIQDIVELSAAQFATFTAVQQATTTIPGGTMINLGNATSLMLTGVDPSSLHASNFALT